MIKKTGRDIYRLRKTKVGRGELDKHMFKEKMAFFTTSKVDVPVIIDDDDDDDLSDSDLIGVPNAPDSLLDTSSAVSSRSSTLKHTFQISHVLLDSTNGLTGGAQPRPVSNSGCGVRLQDASEDATSSSSSTCSTPTPNLKRDDDAERFSYEIDPDIGVIV
jgi:hypothetical protein